MDIKERGNIMLIKNWNMKENFYLIINGMEKAMMKMEI